MNKGSTKKPATNKPSPAASATAASAKSVTTDEYSDTVINQKSRDVNALKNIRGELVQMIANSRVILQQLEKDLKAASKATQNANVKKRITDETKQVDDLERRRQKVEQLLLDLAKTTETKETIDRTVKVLALKAAIPKEMQKLEGLKRWPIILDEIGNLKSFYRVNELLIEIDETLTKERIQLPLQRCFFGLSFNPDGSVNDHRTYSIPNEVNRLIAIVMNDNDIGRCVEQLKGMCNQIHPDLFESVFVKADVKESERDNIQHLFQMTQTATAISDADYYQFGAKQRAEIPFHCVWMTQKTEIPAAYDHLFGPRFRIE